MRSFPGLPLDTLLTESHPWLTQRYRDEGPMHARGNQTGGKHGVVGLGVDAHSMAATPCANYSCRALGATGRYDGRALCDGFPRASVAALLTHSVQADSLPAPRRGRPRGSETTRAMGRTAGFGGPCVGSVVVRGVRGRVAGWRGGGL